MDLSSLTFPEGTPEEIAAGLKEHHPDVWKAINQPGYRAGYAKGTAEFEGDGGRLTVAQEEIDHLKAQLAEHVAKIETLSESQPDFAKEQAKYELLLQEKQTALDNALAEKDTLTKDFTTKLDAKDVSIFDEGFARTLTQMGVKPIYVNVARKDEAYTSRRVKDGPTFKVYQEDGKTPFQMEEGKAPYAILAEDYFKTIPKEFVADSRSKGPGFQHNGEAGGARTMKMSEFNAKSLREQTALQGQIKTGDLALVDD